MYASHEQKRPSPSLKTRIPSATAQQAQQALAKLTGSARPVALGGDEPLAKVAATITQPSLYLADLTDPDSYPVVTPFSPAKLTQTTPLNDGNPGDVLGATDQAHLASESSNYLLRLQREGKEAQTQSPVKKLLARTPRKTPVRMSTTSKLPTTPMHTPPSAAPESKILKASTSSISALNRPSSASKLPTQASRIKSSTATSSSMRRSTDVALSQHLSAHQSPSLKPSTATDDPSSLSLSASAAKTKTTLSGTTPSKAATSEQPTRTNKLAPVARSHAFAKEYAKKTGSPAPSVAQSSPGFKPSAVTRSTSVPRGSLMDRAPSSATKPAQPRSTSALRGSNVAFGSSAAAATPPAKAAATKGSVAQSTPDFGAAKPRAPASAAARSALKKLTTPPSPASPAVTSADRKPTRYGVVDGGHKLTFPAAATKLTSPAASKPPSPAARPLSDHSLRRSISKEPSSGGKAAGGGFLALNLAPAKDIAAKDIAAKEAAAAKPSPAAARKDGVRSSITSLKGALASQASRSPLATPQEARTSSYARSSTSPATKPAAPRSRAAPPGSAPSSAGSSILAQAHSSGAAKQLRTPGSASKPPRSPGIASPAKPGWKSSAAARPVPSLALGKVKPLSLKEEAAEEDLPPLAHSSPAKSAPKLVPKLDLSKLACDSPHSSSAATQQQQGMPLMLQAPGDFTDSDSDDGFSHHSQQLATVDDEADAHYYVYKTMTPEERRRLEDTIKRLPRKESRQMRALLESMIQARETCEGVAYRGHRMLEQVTAEFKSFKEQAQQQQAALEEQVDVFARLAKANGTDPDVVYSELKEKDHMLRQQNEQLNTMEHMYTELITQLEEQREETQDRARIVAESQTTNILLKKVVELTGAVQAKDEQLHKLSAMMCITLSSFSEVLQGAPQADIPGIHKVLALKGPLEAMMEELSGGAVLPMLPQAAYSPSVTIQELPDVASTSAAAAAAPTLLQQVQQQLQLPQHYHMQQQVHQVQQQELDIPGLPRSMPSPHTPHDLKLSRLGEGTGTGRLAPGTPATAPAATSGMKVSLEGAELPGFDEAVAAEAAHTAALRSHSIADITDLPECDSSAVLSPPVDLASVAVQLCC